MSHIVDIEIEIKDIEAVKELCKENGWTFNEGATSYAWWGTRYPDSKEAQEARQNPPKGIRGDQLGTCHHSISFPRWDFELGLHRLPSGGYKVLYDDLLHCDSWCEAPPPLGTVKGNAGSFFQQYGVIRASRLAKSRGWIVKREKRGTDIVLRLSGMA